ncbi:MAG TPA: T9SS type A sorting domain-containing protein [Bacteroidales bacterium]|nr:T9SS type A sorting domain-containing protein [Bacteroidales bacterium]
MKFINSYILFLVVYMGIHSTGFAQTINLSKGLDSPTVIEYSGGDSYYNVYISDGESTPLQIPDCKRLYKPNNSFYSFTANNSGSFCIEHDFRDSIVGGISLFTINNNQINVSELMKGIYLLKIQIDNNILETKFIKQ